MNALSGKRSKLPFVGQWLDKLKHSINNFMDKFETTKGTMDGLVSEVEHMQQGLRTRNQALEQRFNAVKEEQRQLGLHVAAGKVCLAEFRPASQHNR